MNARTALIGLLPAMALSACASVGEIPTARVASATLMTANGIPAGTAQITAAGDVLTLTLVVAALPAGVHGVHLHTAGSCDAPDFKTAGGHLNPAGHKHGSMNPAGSHLGDLPNLTVTDNGTGTFSAQLPGTTSELAAQLFDTDGTAIVVHAGPDDYKTDPSGNSGARIACGVIKRA